MAPGATTVEPLTSFLRDALLKLDADNWSAFAFARKDWEVCAKLLVAKGGAIEANFVHLVLEYILANTASVQALYDLNRHLSTALLGAGTTDLAEVLERTPEDALQSLMIFRVECAIRQGSVDTIRDHLGTRFTNKWCKTRFLFPLVYQFVNRTRAAGLDGFLSYIVTGKEHFAEQIAIKLLLSDEAARDRSLAFKLYVGLMGHPYDACEMLLDHVEFEIAAGRPPASQLVNFVSTIAATFPNTRAARMERLLSTAELRLESVPGGTELQRWFDLSAPESSCYASLCAFEPSGTCDIGDEGRPLAILSAMRRNDYPSPAEFQQITADQFTWWFLDGGCMIEALLRLIYMIDRTHYDLEARSVLRLLQFYNCLTPLIASAPAARQTLRKLGCARPSLQMDLDSSFEITDRQFSERRPFSDRLWINDLQWGLGSLEVDGKVTEWLKRIRAEDRVRPSYLTGINWEWVEGMIEAVRIRPFLGFDGAFLFLLMDFETVNVDMLRMKLALEPFTKNKPFDDVIELLLNEFNHSAPAFVRRFLTVQNLLVLGLAPNAMAAISQRVQALEACIKRHSFGPLLTEEMYESETKALMSELLLHNVNTGKFEIPWDTFKKDMVEMQQDFYLAFCTMRPKAGGDVQYRAMSASPYSYPNGRGETYRYMVYQGPLYSLIVSLISSFMEHSAFGIEIILSGRFRHNTLLQEIWSSLTDVSASTIPSVLAVTQKRLIAPYREAVERIIEHWCSEYMHSERPLKPNGLFNVAPDQRALEGMLARGEVITDLLEITDVVVDWLKATLRGQIVAAREKFMDDIPKSLNLAFGEIRDRQLAQGEYRDQDVLKVSVAVQDAVTRRVEGLASWFDGIDAVTSGPITMRDLCMATEALFDGVADGKKLEVFLDSSAREYSFPPLEVKIAFEMLREIFFNTVKYALPGTVGLAIAAVRNTTAIMFSFCSPTAESDFEKRTIAGSRYTDKNEALFREGNSGLLKIAASSATLMGCDVSIEVRASEGVFHLELPLPINGSSHA